MTKCLANSQVFLNKKRHTCKRLRTEKGRVTFSDNDHIGSACEVPGTQRLKGHRPHCCGIREKIEVHSQVAMGTK